MKPERLGRTGGEVERQSQAAGVGAGQRPPAAGQNCQLLEAQAGSPQREVVASVIGLKHTVKECVCLCVCVCMFVCV